MPKVSVVIPVYNVEPYIEKCLHSLFGQTLADMEFLFVDDGSTDGSVTKITEILASYPHRESQTRILYHGVNLGVAAARTTGIKTATGDYIIHCDPDDYVESDMYETMYNKAIDTNADIVACYYWEEWPHQKKLVRRKYEASPQACLKNIYRKNRHCSRLWDKLIRRSLITSHNIVPFEDCDYAEDLGCMVRILYHAASITVIEKPLYHYCRRNNSITCHTKTLLLWDMRKRVTDRICTFLNGNASYRIVCHQMQFYAKMEYRDIFIGREKEWFNIYRDSHMHILRYDDIPLKGRILWWIVLQNYTLFRTAKKLVPILQ